MAEHTGSDDHRALWVAIGVAIAVLIAIALLRFVGPLLAAVFLYYAVRPIYRRIHSHVEHPNVAVAITLFLVALPMILVVAYALLLIAQELDRALSSGVLEGVRPYAQPYLRFARQGEFQRLQEAVAGPGGVDSATLRTLTQDVLGRFTGIASTVLGFVAQTFLLAAFLFYLLRDGHAIRTWFYRSVGYDDRVVEFLDAVDDDLETVFFNNLVFVVLTSVQAAVLYLLLNLAVPGGQIVGTPVLLAALVGIGTIVPVVGMKVAYLPYAAYLGVLAATTATPIWHPIAFLVVSVVVVDTIPDVLIRPYLSARGSIHMGLVLLGYVLGTMTFGWYGLFLGPIVVVATFHFAHSVFPWLATSYLRK